MIPGNPIYGWTLLAGLAVSAVFWARLARKDGRLLVIYAVALIGAFVGAKIVYLAAEGWLFLDDPDRFVRWATGKSILGGLLGGYLGVEGAKRLLGYEAATGDWFATIVPWGIILGRVGCLFHGCCGGVACSSSWFSMRDGTGVDRWPSVPVEILFNLLCLAVFWRLRRRKILTGQHFHVYLIAYGLFRFVHEFARDCPRIAGPFTGYQVAALAVMALGLAGFWNRKYRTGRGNGDSRGDCERSRCDGGIGMPPHRDGLVS